MKKDRRRTIDCALTQLPRTPRNGGTHQVARILPQRVIAPGPTTLRVQSIWFQSESEHPDLGVSLTDTVENGAEGLVIAPEDRVFEGFGLEHDEMQFSILVSILYAGADSPTNRRFTVARLWAYFLDRFHPHQVCRGEWSSVQIRYPRDARRGGS